MCQHKFHCIAIIDNGCIPFKCTKEWDIIWENITKIKHERNLIVKWNIYLLYLIAFTEMLTKLCHGTTQHGSSKWFNVEFMHGSTQNDGTAWKIRIIWSFIWWNVCGMRCTQLGQPFAIFIFNWNLFAEARECLPVFVRRWVQIEYA